MRLPKFLTKQSRTWSAILRLTGKEAVWTRKDYAAFAKEGYQKNENVFACINKITDGIAGLKWQLKERTGAGKEKEITEHPLLSVIQKPNPTQGQGAFSKSAIGFLLIAGNSYIERVGAKNKPPTELYSLRPDRMKALPGNNTQLISGYRYSVMSDDTPPFPAEEILHLKYFHPTDDFYGLSPLEIAARGIDISNLLMQWNNKLLQNDCRPPGAFISKVSMSDKDYERTLKEIHEKKGGAEHAGEIMLLAGGELDWKQYSISPKDMDWQYLDRSVLLKICTILNVPPELVGDSEHKIYSNYKEARLALWMECIMPLADWYRDELNSWLTPLFGERLRLDYDRDQIEAIREKRSEAYVQMAQAWWLTLNEKRIACGYGEVKGGDEILVPLSYVPMESSEHTEEPPIKGSLLVIEKKSFWKEEKRKRLYWDNFVARIEAKEKSFVSEAEKYLRAQGKDLKERILRLAGKANLKIDAEKLFNVKDEIRKYARTFKARYVYMARHAGEAGINATKGELYVPEESKAENFNFGAELQAELDRMILESGTTINKDTLELIKEILKKGDAEDWTVEQTAQELGNKFDEISVTRGRLIARTETTKIENWGQVEGYRQTEFVEKKGWLSAFLETSRDAHMAASDQEVLLDGDFEVGGESLGYPGDPRGTPGNVCNCVCTTYPVVGA